MNPEEIPQMLRDIADTLEQMLGGGQGAPQGEMPPVDIAQLTGRGGGQRQQG